MNYQPIKDRVIIEEIKEDKIHSGLTINDKSKFREGIIINMSNNIKEPEFKIGDKVAYNILKCEELFICGKKYHLIEHDGVIAIVH